MSKIDDNNINDFEPEESNAPQPVEEKKFGDVRDFARDMEEIVDIPDEDLEPDPDSAESYAAQKLKEAKKLKRQERENNRRQLAKIGAFLLFSVIVFIYMSIAWFTMNRDSSAGGMGVKVGGPKFDIENISGSRDGIFMNPYHIAVHEDEALYWQVTSTRNLENYNLPVDNADPELSDPGDQGIHPGSEGVISFNVIPKTDSITLDFDFEILGYQESYNANNELVMTPLSEVAGGDGITAQNLINGHILLFEHRSGTAGNYVYSTPICSNAQMHRIMNRTVTGKDTATQIDIYWVWPNTLSNLVNSSASGVTTVPFCIDNDAYQYDSYSAIVENVESFPHYYLKGARSNDTISAVNDIGAHYSSYGDKYDQGDNEIGMRVHYLLIKLSVTERTAGGGGS